MNRPTYSLIHTTARLDNDGWKPAYFAWLKDCANPPDVEYVVAIDEKDLAKWSGFPEGSGFGRQILTINRKRTCAVDGWNAAGEASTGQFLITVADDFRPCPNWDEEIRKVVPDMSREVVLDVNYGKGATPHFFYFSLFTRARYERLGYVFWPEFWGMYGDNDFTAHSQKDGCVVDATHLLFPHLHAAYGLSEDDEVYQWQQRPEAYRVGREVFQRRLAEGFPPLAKEPQKKPVLVVCMPGESFSVRWVAAWDALRCFLSGFFDVKPLWSSGSNVYAVRNRLAAGAVAQNPDLVLWLDDDNIIEPRQFYGLYTAVCAYPDSIIAAWCWCQPDGFRTDERLPSCGNFDAHGCCVPVDPAKLEAPGDFDLLPMGYTGFPCVLMSGALLAGLGANPFTAFLGEQYEYGMSGEDSAFCKRVTNSFEAFVEGRKAGRVLVDRHVRIEHLKLGEAGPRETKRAGKPTLLQRAGEKVKELIGA